MMAATSTGRRAHRNRQARRPNAWLLGLIIGIVGGITLAVTHPAPNIDVIKVEATDWYTNMHDLVAPDNQVSGSAPSGDPQHTAAPPGSLPSADDPDANMRECHV